MKPHSIFEFVIILALVAAVLGAIVIGTVAAANFAQELQKIRRAAALQVGINEPLIFRVSK
jgi:hypothetical protein